MKKLSLLIIAIILSISVNGQSAAGYSFSNSAGTYTAITGGTQIIAPSVTDALSAVTPIGFNFVYCGVTYTSFKASPNGFVYMGGTQTATLTTNDLSGATNNLIIAPFWDDLKTDATGNVSYLLSGSSPNRILTIEFKNMMWYTAVANLINFQVKFYEANGVIQYVYGAMAATPGASAGASIGITDQWGGTGHFLSITPASTPASSTTTAFNSIIGTHITYLPSGTTYTFTPASCLTSPLTIKTTGGNYNSFTAAINDLNLKGVCTGGVIFNVDAGFTSTENCPVITTSTSAGNPVIFRKSGSGSNPKIVAGIGTSTSADAIITIKGSDYVTFDGIDLEENAANNTATKQAEYGILIMNNSATDGAQYDTIRNCRIVLNRTNTATKAIYQYTPVAPSALSGCNSYNTFQAVTIENTYWAIHLAGSGSTYCDAGTVVRNCVIGAASANDIGNGANAVSAARFAYQSGISVYNNEIRNVTTTGAVNLFAMYLESCYGTSTVYNNTIHDITSTSTSASAVLTGLRLDIASGATANVYNNMVSGFTHAINTASASLVVYGIRLSGAGTVNLYYNSIRIGQSAYASCAAFHSTSSIITTQNNIFANFSTPGATSVRYCFYFSSGTLTASNYNDFYIAAGTGNYVGYYTAAKTALSDWQLATSKDGFSINVDPVFTSTTDLHAAAPGINEAATPVAGITTDFDGQTRNSTRPDIGADEFSPPNDDAAITAINRDYCPGSQNVTVTLKNNGLVNLTTVKIDWSVNGVSQTQNSWSGILIPGATANVTLTPAYSFSAGGSYDIIATSSLPNGNLDANASNNTWTELAVKPQMTGDFTVGSGGAYATLTAAVADVNTLGVCGPVRFKLMAGYTGSSDVFPITINQVAGASATNTITIMPNAGATVSITGSSTTSIIKLNGADYVIIDGSNNGTSSRDLTITNTNTTTLTVAVWVGSIGTGAGATNCTIKNCNIICGINTTSNIAGIFSGAASSLSSGGDDNDNLTIQNNAISKAYYGIYCNAASTGVHDNLTISGNIIGSSVVANYIVSRGIYINGAANAVVSGNEIYNMISAVTTTVAGIEIADYVTNSVVSSNAIHDIQNNYSAGSGAYGINLAGSTNSTGNQVDNNMIYKINSTNYSISSTTYNPFGIRISGGTGYKIYYNAVNLTGTQYPSGTTASLSAAFVITSSSVTGADIRNNIFSNSIIGVAGSMSYAAYIASGTTFTNIDYNDYYSSGSYGILGYFGTDKTTLSAWQAATGRDAHSLNLDPEFISVSNLHTSTPNLDAKGVAISGITADFDGDVRNSSTPDIGADEFTPANDDASISAISRAYCPGLQGVSVTLKNNGLTTLTSVKIDWSVGGVSQAQNTWTGTLAPGAVTNVILTPGYLFSGASSYNIAATSSLPNGNTDGNTSNDSWSETAIRPQMTGDYTIGSGGNYATLTAAVADLNSIGVCGPVRFKLLNGYTGSSDVFPVTIEQVAGASATNTITILPDAGATVSISGSSATSIIKLNGADFVIIDGSNNGSSSRNMTITNTNTATLTVSIWVGSLGTGSGATNNTIKNCNISCGINSTANIAGIFSGSAASLSLGGDDNDNLTIRNNAISKAYYGIYCNAAATGVNDNLTITGNIIGSVTAANYITCRGIYINGASSPVVNGNEIFNMISAITTSVAGIEIADYVTNGLVSKNSIHDIQNNYTAGSGVYGINLAGSTNSSGTQVDNNMIYKINSTNYSISSTTYNPFGIRISGGTGYKIFYNTVSLSGTQFLSGSAATLSSAFMITTTSVTGSDIRNNIFANGIIGLAGSLSYAAYIPSGTTLTNIDYNDYYSYGTYGVFGYFGSDQLTLSAWRSVTGRDAHSVNVNPEFVSASNVHATSPNIDSRGIAMGSITTDIDNDTRNASTPDIGADEFTPANDDAAISGISRDYCAGSQSVIVTLKNNGGVALGSVVIDWSVSGAPQTQYLWNGSLAPGATTAVSIGTYSFITGTSYTISAATSLPNGNTDANTSNDSWSEGNIKTQMSGNYIIGTGGNFLNLRAACDTLNLRGMCGAVTFTLNSSYPGSAETLPITINQVSGMSAVNTLTIKPATGVNTTVSGSSVSAVIKLNGADYVTIDGSNNGTNSQNLTITNTYAASATAAIWLSSVAAGAGATYNTIKNCNISCGIDPSTSTSSTFGIISNGAVIAIGTGAADNDNNQFVNNNITKVQYGIASVGLSGNLNQNTVIRSNKIGPSAFGSTEIGKCGIILSYENAAVVDKNDIGFVGNKFAQTVGAFDKAGIVLAADISWTASSTAVTNSSITGNYIHDLSEEKTASAIGIISSVYNSGNATSNIIANNMLWNILANGTSSDQTIGIALNEGNGDKVVNNSIYLAGDIDPTGTTAANVSAYGIKVGTASSNLNLTLKNNAVYVDLTSNTSTLYHYSLGLPSSMVWGTGGIDYNDYYTNPSNTQSRMAYVGSTAHLSITAAFKTATLGDANSKNVDPGYLFSTNLHSASSSLNGAATPIAGILDDIDGQVRNTTAPDIGADEFSYLGTDIGISAIDRSICGGSNTVNVTLTNYGNTTISAATLTLTVNGTIQSPAYSWTGSLAPNANVTVPLTYNGTFNIGTSYTIDAASSNPSPGPDGYATNDTKSETAVLPRLSPNTYTVGSGGNYTYLKDVAAALNTNGICGPVVFQILPAYSSAGETWPITFNAISGSSAVNTVTIKPATGASPTVSGTLSAALIVLNGANYLKIDGSNTINGTTRDLTIVNLSTSSSSRALQFTNNASNDLVKNCIVKSSGNVIDLLNSTAVSGCSNDTISTCDILNSGTTWPANGIYLYNSSGLVGNNIVIQDNNIYNFSTNGINLYQYYNNTIISGNNIYQTAGQSIANVNGIYIFYTQGTATITRNKIHDLKSTYSTPTIAGIYYDAGSTAENIYITNNFICLDAATTNQATVLYGIVNYSGSLNTTYVYHNSVYIGGTAVTGTSISACYYQAGAYPSFLKNNILFNARSNGSGSGKNYCIYIASTTGMPALTSDNNDLLATGIDGNIGYDGATTQADTTSWKTTGKDPFSISIDPSFTNVVTADLHASSSAIMARGSVIPAVTVDYDNQARPLSPGKPCIGADEFSPPQNDAGISAINRVYCIGTQPVAVTLSNFGLANLTAAKIDWSVNGVAQTQNNWTGNIMPGGSTTVTLTPSYSSFTFGNGVSITASTSLPNGVADGNTSNDSKTESAIYPRISGTFTVGNLPSDFKTLYAADSSLKIYGICGPVELLIKSVYPAAGKTETFPISFNGIPGISAINTITIKPAPGASPTISGTLSSPLFTLSNTQYVTIDGSNTSGGTTKDLTITNNSTSSSSRAIQYSNGASNNVLKNCIVKSSGNVVEYYISISSPACSNDTLSNCDILNSGSTWPAQGVYLNNPNGITGNNIVIQNNNIYNFSTYGICLYQFYNNTLITGNNIYQTAGQGISLVAGIYVMYTQGTANITKNKIHDLKSTASTPTLAGIYYDAGSTTENLNINNNFICLDGATTSQASVLYGIVNYSGTLNTSYIYHNSVYIGGTAVTGTSISSCYYQAGAYPTYLKNNIFYNARSNGSGTGKNYCIYMAGATGMPALTSDYNDLLATGTDGTIGYDGTTNQTDTTAWKTTGKDPHSISVDPSYFDMTTSDLHASSSGIMAKGSVIAAVTVDYDNQPRPTSPNKPCIGADEFSPPQDDAGISAIDRTFCIGTQPVTVTLANFGIGNLNTVKIDWSVNGVAQPQNTWTGTLIPGSSTTVTLSPAYSSFIFGTPVSITASTSMPNGVADAVQSNDAQTESAIYPRISGTFTVGNPPSDFKTLYAADSTLKIFGVCGPVILQIKSVYPAAGKTETFPMSFNGIPGISASNTVTIKPAPGASPVIAGTLGAPLFTLNNSEFVIFDGSNTIGGTTKDLTITNNSTSSNGRAFQFTNGSANNMLKNCIIKSSGYVIDFYTSVSAPGCSYDTVSNCDILNSGSSLPVYGICLNNGNGFVGNNIVIQNNNIYNFSTYGIYQYQYYNNTVISGNNIYQTAGQNISTVAGVFIVQTQGTAIITKNRIHDLKSTYTTPTIAGIYYDAAAAAEDIVITNNFICLDGASTSQSTVLYGIVNYSATLNTTYVYHNSVYIGGTAVTGTSISTCYYQYGAYTTYMKNNIFYNARSNGSGTGKNYCIYVASATGMPSLISDYNDLLATGTDGVIGYDGTTNHTDTTAWKALGKDAHSVSVNPSYLNIAVGDLHACASPIWGRGEIIATVTDDYDSQPRPAGPNKPCIGGDEFLNASNDAGVTAIIVNGCMGSQTVSVTMKNFGFSTLVSDSIYWSVNSVAQPPVAWTGSVANGSTALVALGNYTFNFGVSNFITAYTRKPNGAADAVPSNDSYTSSGIMPSLSGVFSVGPGGNFKTLYAADSTMKLYGICGPVTLQVAGTYPGTATETFPLTFNAISGVSAANTITIKPAPAATVAISGSSTTGIFSFSGTKYLVIDGSNTTGGTSKDLTITNTSATTAASVIFYLNSTSNTMIKNCLIKAGCTGTSSYAVQFSTSASAPGCSNDTISNCDISNYNSSWPATAVYLNGSSGALGNNNVIQNNNVYNFSTNGIYQSMYYTNTLISGNNVYQSVGQSIYTVTGIYVYYTHGTTTITKNNIHDLKSTYTILGPTIRGVYFGSGNASDVLYVTNNFISLDGATNNNSTFLYAFVNNGISTTTAHVYHNSFYIGGSAVSGSNISACIYQQNAYPCILKNNILFNGRSNGSGTGKHYCIYVAAGLSSLTSDYNDLLVTGNGGLIGFDASTDKADTTAWKATGKDTHSISVNPAYTDVTTANLHASFTGIWNKGDIISLVTDDYDGQPRPVSPNKPCIGADEFSPAPNDAGITAINRIYCAGAQPVTVTITNYGSANLTSAKINWSVNSVAQPQNTWTGSIAPGNAAAVTLTPSYSSFLPAVPYSITASTSLPNNAVDPNTGNDAKTESGIYVNLSGILTVGEAPSDFKTLTAADSTMKIYGVCGPVVLQLKSVYPAPGKSETFPLTFNNIANVSATNTITIKPAPSATPVITGSHASQLFDFNATKYVIIDGSNTSGGTTKDLTISNTNTSGRAIRFINDGSNNVVKNTVIKGCGTGTTVIIFSTTSSTGSSNDSIVNCDITSGTAGTAAKGVWFLGSAGLSGQNNSVVNCNIYNFSGYGVHLENYYNNTLIKGCNIYEVATQSTATIYGIYVNYSGSIATITGNRIYNLSTSASSAVIRAIYYNNGTAPDVLNVNNNFIALDGNTTTQGASIIGMYNFPGTATLNFINNSVYIGGTNLSTASTTACFWLNGAYPSNVRNNILYNARSTGNGKNYCIYVVSGGMASLKSDYNDLLASGTGGKIGYNGTTDQTDTTAWKALAKDTASRSVNPNFTNVATGDLHMCEATLFRAGKSYGIGGDIDGQLRSNPPCIGADEVFGSSAPATVSATINPVCAGSATTLSVNGGSLGSGASWHWYSGSCGGTAAGTGNSISVSPAVATDYFVRAEGCAGNTLCANLTVTIKTLSVAAVSATATPMSICSGDSTLLSLSGGTLGTGAVWKWYDGSCGGTSIGTGASLKVSPASTTTYYVRAEGDCNTTLCVSVSPTVTICGTNWTGAVNTSWINTGNWSTGIVPTASVDVVIPNVTNKPVITSAAVCKGLTINSGATVTINPGYSLTASGPTVLNGAQCLILKASATKAASFIDNGSISGSGTARIERYITANDWHYISSPINNATAALFSGSYLKKWTESTYSWLNITSLSTPLIVTTGYAAKTTVNKTIAFIGRPNTGTYVIPVTRNTSLVPSKQGWNLIGNPYPSAINWDAPGMIRNHVDNAIYIYNQQYSNYATYVGGFGTNGASGFIAAEQGFYVTCSSPFTSGSLTMNNSVRVHKDTTFFKKSGPSDFIRLKVHEGAFTDEIIIRYLSLATDLFDSNYDALKMLGTGTQLWSTTYADTSISYSINALGSVQLTPDVPLRFRAGASGTFSITANDFMSFAPTINIILEDTKMSTMINIRQDSVYQFTADPADDVHRFVLHFTDCANAPATPVVIQAGNDLVSDAITGNQWYEQSGVVPGATDQVFTPAFNGIYFVIVSSGGCSSAPSNQVSFAISGISSSGIDRDLELTPNPSNGLFRISSNVLADQAVRLEVYNMLGETVYSEGLSGLSVHQLDMRSFADGVYYLKVSSAVGQSVRKFVISR